MRKQKTVWSLLVCAVIGIFLLAPVNTALSAAFTDIKGHWAESYINKLVNGG